ncbi:glyoxalase/bleomycin resistance protein/dioxygenase superfamily protein [Paenibacillus cellulosilyticus]|uniref:Glyoxalase/bleomycin resistance protein/dioxygenase superfamily protein n=1 Tax=Paenibacillus cellulosilyticus TaxID=375489 RepID=A0A2V2YVQ1_9BACL|nr:VOC family protein [Paenibacillus cellulosilyticus]PWW02540.1 glyoxalase/bleomycin resistance protein/dioxygenase superfamily protein [Paenibacillus cellulosilyticus]
MGMFYGVGIFVPVSDLKRSTEWYKNMLGFEITFNDEPKATVTMMNDERIMFCLVQSYDIVPPKFPRNDYGVGQYYNFHTTDVQGAHRMLQEKGATVGDIHDFDGMQGFSLTDPDGNLYGVVN